MNYKTKRERERMSLKFPYFVEAHKPKITLIDLLFLLSLFKYRDRRLHSLSLCVSCSRSSKQKKQASEWFVA